SARRILRGSRAAGGSGTRGADRGPIQFGRAGLRPARLYSRRAAARRAGYAVSAFGDDPSRGRGKGEIG
ncbi:hypothetical protein, partial [Aminobacter carboxidus]|uniref:hypothetical protein n=1 Tax=Aminobacter carboxidus TaxID=376165 RepID=UPI001AED6D78